MIENQQIQSTIPCPYCGEPILPIAKKCKHCGEFLNNESKPTTVHSNIQSPTNGLAIGKWVLLVLGAMGLLFSLTTMLNEQSKWGKHYEPSEGIITIIVISAIVFYLGLMMLVCTNKTILTWAHKHKTLLWVMFGISLFIPWLGWLSSPSLLTLAIKAKKEKK